MTDTIATSDILCRRGPPPGHAGEIFVEMSHLTYADRHRYAGQRHRTAVDGREGRGVAQRPVDSTFRDRRGHRRGRLDEWGLRYSGTGVRHARAREAGHLASPRWEGFHRGVRRSSGGRAAAGRTAIRAAPPFGGRSPHGRGAAGLTVTLAPAGER